MLKKTMALLVAAAMTAGALTACASPAPAPQAPAAESQVPEVAFTQAPLVSAQAPAAAEPQWFDAFESADLGGVTIKTHHITDPMSVDEAVREPFLQRQEIVEKKFNVKLTFQGLGETITWTDVPNQLLTSVAAGDPLVDIFQPSRYYVAQFMLNDLLADITDDVIAFGLPESYYAGTWWDNRIIGFHSIPLTTYEHLIYDRGIILDVGMEKTPGEMFMEGKWSWDDFYDYLVELKSKLPEDIAPFYSNPLRMARKFVYANGGMVQDSHTNLPMYNTEPYFQTIEFMQKLYRDGLYHGLTPTGVNDAGQVTYRTSVNPYVWGESLVIQDGFNWNYETEAYVNMDWGIVPYPWGPNVTFNEDFTSIDDMLEGYYSSNHDQSFFAIVKGRGAGLVKASGTDYINMMFTYNENNGKQLIVNLERIAEGLPAVDREYGTERFFQTELDVLLYDWQRFHIPTLFNPQDTLYPSGTSPILYGSTNGFFGPMVAEGASPRTVIEAIFIADCANLIDSGFLDPAVLDDSFLAEIEEFLEELHAEDEEAEAE